jgi:hypothetical protein
MNLSVSSLANLVENMAESPDPKFRKNPVNEEHDGQVCKDEVIMQTDIQLQILQHGCSFLRFDNS